MKYTNDFLKQIMNRYLNEKISLIKLGKEYNIDRRTLSSHFKQMGVNVINRQNEIKFNEHVFDKIDTEEKAY
jgi:transcriptional regulator GlxA family with amidase domain